MRILFLSQGQNIEDHPGHHDALVRLRTENVLDDFTNLPYRGFARAHGYKALWAEIIRLAGVSRADVVYFQHYHHPENENPQSCIHKLRELPSRPVIISSSGDAISVGWLPRYYPVSFRQCARSSDVVFSTQMGSAAEAMRAWGARNVVLLPNGMCQVRFSSLAIDPVTHVFDFDICFIGSKNIGHSPFHGHFWMGRKRIEQVKLLQKRYGKRFGLFGHGWHGMSSWQGPIPFKEIQQTYRRGRVGVDGYPYSHYDYYASNRPFFAIASGVPTVMLRVPRLDRILSPSLHAYYADDCKGVVETCDRILNEDPRGIYQRAADASKDIADRHTNYQRMKFIVDVCRSYQECRGSLTPELIKFPYFSKEIDAKSEYPYCFYSSPK